MSPNILTSCYRIPLSVAIIICLYFVRFINYIFPFCFRFCFFKSSSRWSSELQKVPSSSGSTKVEELQEVPSSSGSTTVKLTYICIYYFQTIDYFLKIECSCV